VCVAGGGTTGGNGTYTYSGFLLNNRPRYGNGKTFPEDVIIYWTGTQWEIYSTGFVLVYYFSTDNVE